MNAANENDRGYIYLQLEPYGFDLAAYVIIQPYGHFYDYNKAMPVNGVTKAFEASWGRQFLIPAEYEIYWW